MKRTTLAAVLVLTCCILLPSGAIAQEPQPPRGSNLGHAPDVVLVKFRQAVQITNSHGAPGTGKDDLDRLLSGHGVQMAERLMPSMEGRGRAGAEAFGLDRIYRLRVAPGHDPVEVAAALSANPAVEYAEPDYTAAAADVPEAPPPLPAASAPAATVPNDPLYADQWGLAAINAATAWEVVTGTPAIVIAVVDSGIDTNHEDLMPNLWVNPGEIPGNGIDDDNNGYVDDIQGWNFVSGSNDIQDGYGHGTQVAGAAAATTNNGLGIAGLCWNCRIMPVKVMADSGVANYSDIAAGVSYAAAKGASVINLSLGGYADSRTLRDAISAAVDQGVVVVGGAGNDGASTPFYPAAYPNVLAVAATTVSDTLAPSSNRGTWVSVAAPGVAITTTYLGGGYGAASGTSMAAPFASGLAGLIRSRWPAWTEAMVRSQMRQTADDIDALNAGLAGQTGKGRINAAAAMQEPHPVLTLAATAVNGDGLGRPTPGQTTTLGITLRNDWWDAAGTTASISTEDSYVTLLSSTSNFGTIATGATAVSTPVYSFTVAAGAGYNHPIAFALSVSANAGTYTTTIPLTVTTRSGEEQISTTITNAVWTSDKTYVVNNSVGVAAGYTLTIQPGTEVRFSSNYTLSVGGTLIADGTPDQPIIFRPNTPGGAWNRIYFRDSSTDAIADAEGAYQSGTILRHVQVLSATNGLVCGGATPYLSHLTTNAGGINCTMGAGDFWLLDSTVTGAVSANGTGHVRQTALKGGALTLGNSSDVLTCTIGGELYLGDDSMVRGSMTHGSIWAGSGGNVSGNTVAAGGILVANAGVVEANVLSNGILQVRGGASVLTNTIKSGGIAVGASTVVRGNDVSNPNGWGIIAAGMLTMTNLPCWLSAVNATTVTGNRVVGSACGISVNGGLIQGNLIANSAGVGLDIGSVTVLSNTLTGNRGSAIRISSGTPGPISGNNLEGNKGPYEIEDLVPAASLLTVTAANNWWGVTDSLVIGSRIWDWNLDDQVGTVVFQPILTGPVQTAPAYVRAITMTPESPVGIQTVTFDVLFSRDMHTDQSAGLRFNTTLKDTWGNFNTGNSDLPGNNIQAVAVDTVGGKWFSAYDQGVSLLRDDGSWQTYNTANSGLAHNVVRAMTVDSVGNKWFGQENGTVSLLRVDGSWQTYGPFTASVWALAADSAGNRWFGLQNGGLILLRADGSTEPYSLGFAVVSIAVDEAGNKWFGTWAGGVRLLRAEGSWQTYNTANSGLADNSVYDIAVDAAGNKWFATSGGVSVLEAGGSWRTYNTGNSGLASDGLWAVAADAAGNKWFGDGGSSGVAAVSLLRMDGTWQIYNASNSGLAGGSAGGIAVDGSGNKWFGSWFEGVSVLYRGAEHVVGNSPLWLGDSQYRATYDFSTLIPRGAYSVTVSGARGVDGIEIAPYSDFTFTVDYAGAVTDKTPPLAPTVTVDICRNSITSTSANWLAQDAESGIDLYSYALGAASGGTEVVNWTTTELTTVVRSGLTLLAGQRYYFSVKARNAAGLWSAPASSSFLAGVECQRVYLPLVLRNY